MPTTNTGSEAIGGDPALGLTPEQAGTIRQTQAFKTCVALARLHRVVIEPANAHPQLRKWVEGALAACGSDDSAQVDVVLAGTVAIAADRLRRRATVGSVLNGRMPEPWVLFGIEREWIRTASGLLRFESCRRHVNSAPVGMIRGLTDAIACQLGSERQPDDGWHFVPSRWRFPEVGSDEELDVRLVLVCRAMDEQEADIDCDRYPDRLANELRLAGTPRRRLDRVSQ